MKTNVARLSSLILLVIVLHVEAGSSVPQANISTSHHTFGWKGEHFLLDGHPFQILSGEMHYARVPRPYWRRRMRLMKAMGLNTLTTYVFWNLHEPKPGQFDFSGNLDIAAFIRTAQQEGLWVILRPGPYICSEWEFGGFPAWLLAKHPMKVRSADPRFLEAAARYMQRVGRELAPLQITHGGPIIMVQVENEYGSFGSDKTYLRAVRQTIVDAGFNVLLFTADGSQKLADGTLPDVLSAINFGASDSPEVEFARFAKFRGDVPKMCGEFWVGWFDAWGDKHHSVGADAVTAGLEWMLARGISVNLYMFHGGTTFGWMNGANKYEAYTPDISSYDYDSPVDEAGRPTPKFFALRDAIKQHLTAGTVLPEVPAPEPMITIPRFELSQSASLFANLPQPIQSQAIKTMEDLGQAFGLILYRTRLPKSGKGVLQLTEPRDYATVYQRSKRLGSIDRRQNESSLQADFDASQPLDILVENMGRINFGPHLVGERKGISDKATLDGKDLTGWDIFSLPLTDPAHLKFSSSHQAGPALYRGTFTLKQLGNTYLDMRGWGKGFVWINGHALGRYWSIGPQQSLFVPANWLKVGKNDVIVFDYEEKGNRSLAGIEQLIFESPAREVGTTKQ
jgi:beta-galactosidase